MAAIWTGAISFGMVHVPVKLHTAVKSGSSGSVSLKMLRKKDLCPIRMKRVCEGSDKEVPWDQITKGYEVRKGEYIEITPEELKEIEEARSENIEILEFVPSDSIDPRYFEKPYYVVPEKGGDRPYALLRDAMKSTSTVGILHFVFSKRQHLAALRPLGDALILEVMHYHNEIVEEDEFRFPGKPDVRPQEMKMAEQLIQNLTEDWKPDKYEDEYAATLEKIIAEKAKTGKISVPQFDKAPEGAQVTSLMEALERSLAAGKKGRGADDDTEEPAPKKRSTAKKATKKRAA
jgi:DNA end-binding protein Ku